MTELEASGVGDPPPPYMIFVVVFLFFITGLLGFLICHLLKKKGYRCRTGDLDDEENEEEKKLEGNTDEDEENQDTVEQILKCIIENEANMEAFNEMLGNRNVCVRHDPRLRKESIGGVPPHHHTVHSGTDHNSCHLCAQVRSKRGRRQSRTPRSKQKPGEQTVFSVGRFRVTHNDKKLHGGPNPLVSSGDQLDQSQDSEERKESGYNLRSMFKDVRSPSESSNGVAPNVGKRRRSLTIFGLRRGSDPVCLKAGEGTGKETGAVRFAIQKQPVVLEEQSQTEIIDVAQKSLTQPEIEPSKNQIPASAQHEAKTLGSVNSPSSQSKTQAYDSTPATEGGSKHGPSPEPYTGPVIKPFIVSPVSPPSSLPIAPPASSAHSFNTTEKGEEVKDKVLENAYDPGPLQTSTPIAPMHGSIAGLTPVIAIGQPKPYSSFPVTTTPPDPSSSADLEPGVGASIALISLGSSPPSLSKIKSPTSLSSLKTPTSPLSVTSSPKLISRNVPSEAKPSMSPAFTPSPKLTPGQGMSSQSLSLSTSPLQARTPSPAQTASSSPADQNPSMRSSPHLTPTSVTSMTIGGRVASPMKEESPISKTEEKTEMKRVGVLKTAKLSPVEGVSVLSSPTDLLPKERLSNLSFSPLSPLSPSSPVGSRVNNVTIVKASPDSKREFSVVTMVEEEETSISIKDQKGETSEHKVKSENAGCGQAVGQKGVTVSGVGQPESQHYETSDTAARLTVSQERDDMVEMEDIRDCRVTQVEEAERADDELEKTGNN